MSTTSLIPQRLQPFWHFAKRSSRTSPSPHQHVKRPFPCHSSDALSPAGMPGRLLWQQSTAAPAARHSSSPLCPAALTAGPWPPHEQTAAHPARKRCAAQASCCCCTIAGAGDGVHILMRLLLLPAISTFGQNKFYVHRILDVRLARRRLLIRETQRELTPGMAAPHSRHAAWRQIV
jgi:hypothetical protein